MKLTKSTLKQIIKEEINKLLREQEIGDPTDPPKHPYDPRSMDKLNLTTDALVLYKALEGWGTDEEAIEEVLNKYVSPNRSGHPSDWAKLARLDDTFNNLPQVKRQKARYGGLVDWLKDDGMDEYARLVSQSLKLTGDRYSSSAMFPGVQQKEPGSRTTPGVGPSATEKWCLYTSRRGNEKLVVEVAPFIPDISDRNMVQGQEWRFVFNQLGVKCNRLPCKWEGKTIHRVERNCE
jgi:hypothetical protein